jgi:hypothetical protein
MRAEVASVIPLITEPLQSAMSEKIVQLMLVGISAALRAWQNLLNCKDCMHCANAVG